MTDPLRFGCPDDSHYVVHDLKTWPEFYEHVATGSKPFEVRREDDRRFEVGHVLRLREWVPSTITRQKEGYTGAECHRLVTYVLRDAAFFGLKEGYCVLGLAKESWLPPSRPRER